MLVKVCLDSEGFAVKPGDKKVIGQISQRIPAQQESALTEQIAKLVGGQGHTFCPAVFRNQKRSRNEFAEMQLFGIDFDDGVSYEEVKKMCDSYGILINFSYHTFSSKPEHPKFRIILCHIVPIMELWLAEMILSMLKDMFPMADKSCFEVSRMFFGGKGLIEVHSENVFQVDILIRQFQAWKRQTDEKNYVRNMARFAKKHGIGLLKGGILNVRTYKNGEMEDFSGNSIKYIQEIPEKSSKIVFYSKGNAEQTLHHHDMCEKALTPEKVDKSRMCQSCQLCKDFFEGNIINHEARFLLATNFRLIAGGKRMFFETMAQYYDSVEKWKDDWRYIQANEYKPKGCDGVCPYAESCDHDINLYLTLKGRRRIIQLDTDEKYVSIEESYRFMDNALRQAVMDSGNTIHLIKGQTGLGKSTAYKRLMAEFKSCMVIAVPTVKLKAEIARSVRGMACEMLSIKDLGMPEWLKDDIDELYGRGLYKEAKKAIADYAKDLDKEEKMRYEQYMKQMDALERKDKHIIMTHAQLLQMKKEQLEGYTIIIDEDILYTMLRNTKSVGKEDIEECLNGGLVHGEEAAKLREVLALKDGAYMRSGYRGKNSTYLKKETLDDREIYGNVNELLRAGSCHCIDDTIEYFVPASLPEKGIIIMSATLNEDVYRLFFKDRTIRVYDTPKARYTGKVIQYTHYPMSRRNVGEIVKKLGDSKKLIEVLRKIAAGAEYNISFMDYDIAFENTLHFGNAAGIDTLKGKNGMIIGTCHLNESSYKLIACYLGIETDGKKEQIRNQKIRYKGYEFSFMTYENEDLRKLQLYMISSELEQCIGRSRLLRENAVVYVFSNFPCEQARLIQEDYLEKYFENREQADPSIIGASASKEIQEMVSAAYNPLMLGIVNSMQTAMNRNF